VLVEVAGRGAMPDLEDALLGAVGRGHASDAAMAKSVAEAGVFWRLRHSLSEVQKFEGASLKHDVAVPIDRVLELLDAGDDLIADHVPGARLCAFGHVGDGNLHYNVSQPAGGDPGEFRRRGRALTQGLYDEVRRLGGTFSAEHGVGSFKKEHLASFRSPAEMSVMRTLKTALDPNGILNPGKVI
jgi:FAD/FMN-containing dehydrogenase